MSSKNQLLHKNNCSNVFPMLTYLECAALRWWVVGSDEIQFDAHLPIHLMHWRSQFYFPFLTNCFKLQCFLIWGAKSCRDPDLRNEIYEHSAAYWTFNNKIQIKFVMIISKRFTEMKSLKKDSSISKYRYCYLKFDFVWNSNRV